MQQCIWSILESRFRPVHLETPSFASLLTFVNRRAAINHLLWQGTHTPSRNRSSSSTRGGGSSPSRPHRVSPTATFLIEVYATVDLTEAQSRALSSAGLLATNATTMAAARSQKDAAAAFANETPTKASSSTPAKRRRRPGEQRFYAVRAGKIPGVYLTWAECQAMINGFAGANCKPTKHPTPDVPRPKR